MIELTPLGDVALSAVGERFRSARSSDTGASVASSRHGFVHTYAAIMLSYARAGQVSARLGRLGRERKGGEHGRHEQRRRASGRRLPADRVARAARRSPRVRATKRSVREAADAARVRAQRCGPRAVIRPHAPHRAAGDGSGESVLRADHRARSPGAREHGLSAHAAHRDGRQRDGRGAPDRERPRRRDPGDDHRRLGCSAAAARPGPAVRLLQPNRFVRRRGCHRRDAGAGFRGGCLARR